MFSSIWLKLGAALAFLLTVLGVVAKIFYSGKKAQREEDRKELIKDLEKKDEDKADIAAGSDDDLVDELRQRKRRK